MLLRSSNTVHRTPKTLHDRPERCLETPCYSATHSPTPRNIISLREPTKHIRILPSSGTLFADTHHRPRTHKYCPRNIQHFRGKLSHSAGHSAVTMSLRGTHKVTPRTLRPAEHTALPTEDCLQPRLYPVTTQLLRDSKTLPCTQNCSGHTGTKLDICSVSTRCNNSSDIAWLCCRSKETMILNSGHVV